LPKTLPLFALTFIFSTPGLLAAQEHDVVDPTWTLDEPGEASGRGLDISVRPGIESTFKSSYDDLELSILRSGVDTDLTIQVSDDVAVPIGFGFEHSRYDWEHLTVGPGLAAPEIEDGYEVSLTPGIRVRHDEEIAWFARGLFTWATTDGGDLSDSFYAGGFAGVSWRVSPQLALTAGAGVVDRFEDSVRVIPILGLDWEISDLANLKVEGPGATFTYDLTEQVELLAFLRYEFRQYRIQEGPGVAGGVLEDERLLTGIGLAWRPGPSIEIRVESGIVPYSEITIENSRGSDLVEENGDLAGWVGGSLRLNF
jgi:hypothetical protein